MGLGSGKGESALTFQAKRMISRWCGAWQVKGRKLFVCFAPSDTKHLHQMETEVETSQSPIDPLEPDLTQVGVCVRIRVTVSQGEG